jgi:hypothetical protein
MIGARFLSSLYWKNWWFVRVRPYHKAAAAVVVCVVVAATLLVLQGRQPPSEAPPRRPHTPAFVSFADVDRELRSGTLFGRWADSNPAELARYEEYMSVAPAGVSAPAMVTPFGRALVLAASLAARGASSPPRDEPAR